MGTDIEYVELIIEDFKEPVLYLVQAIFVSIVCLVLVMSIYKIKNMKSSFRQDGHKGRILLWLLFISYIWVVIQTAFFSREPGSRKKVSLLLFETWGNTFRMHTYFIENIIMFVPFGVLLPIHFHKMEKCRYCVLTGFLCSCAIETAQLITQRGFFQVDDILTNTTGALIGWCVWRGVGSLFHEGKHESTGLR